MALGNKITLKKVFGDYDTDDEYIVKTVDQNFMEFDIDQSLSKEEVEKLYSRGTYKVRLVQMDYLTALLFWDLFARVSATVLVVGTMYVFWIWIHSK